MNVRRFLFLSGTLLAMISCNGNRNHQSKVITLEENALSNSILTAEEQTKLTPDQVIALLQKGILKEMEENGKIKIVGAIYDMHTGIVEFI